MKHALSFTAALMFTATSAALAAEVPRPTVLGAAGEVYTLRAGTYGDLFPQLGLAPKEAPVLAFETRFPDGAMRRRLVPGTDTADLEDAATMLFEDATNTVFVLWQSRVNVIHSTLNLAGWKPGGWSEVIEISGNPFGFKSSPQIAVTRDSFGALSASGEFVTHERKVLHVLWWEDTAKGPRAFYAPVIFVDGSYLGWNPVYQLDELSGGNPLPTAAATALARAPRIQPGKDGQGIVIGFINGTTGKLASLAIDVLPGEIGFIAEQARAQIVDLGNRLGRNQISYVAEQARAQIVDLGNRLRVHPVIAVHLADEVSRKVREAAPEDKIDFIAEGARAQIVDLGSRLNDKGLVRSEPLAAMTMSVARSEGDSQPSLFRVQPAADLPTPELNLSSQDILPSMYLSDSGKNVLVSWQEGDAVQYRETLTNAAGTTEWSAIRTLRLDDLSLEQANEILARRIRERAN